MMLVALLVLVLPILTGGLLVHLLWPARGLSPMMLKAFLGIGIGLGVRSLLYFAYLLLFAGQRWFFVIELVAFVIVLGLAVWKEMRRKREKARGDVLPSMKGAVRAVAAAAAVVFVVSLLTTANYLLRRRQGDWDAWMMYNRAARFIYLDQAHWLGSFSPKMDPIFHPDYPLMLATNISAGWDVAGRDAAQVPMMLSAVYSIACLGLLVGGLAVVRSVGQAALGAILLWGIPGFVNEGARQMADVPLAFFILATGLAIHLFFLQRKPGLLVLAGLSAGMGAWTKNEGSALIIGALAGLIVAGLYRRSWRELPWFAAGLVAPLAAVLYFKLALAPRGDILSLGPTRWIQQITDASRHLQILQVFGQDILTFGNWWAAPLAIGILPILLIDYLLFRSPIPLEQRPAHAAGITILVIQMIGYYAAYLISPYDLAWHLSFSSPRLVLQIFPLLLFLILGASVEVESVLAPEPAKLEGVSHAARD